MNHLIALALMISATTLIVAPILAFFIQRVIRFYFAYRMDYMGKLFSAIGAGMDKSSAQMKTFLDALNAKKGGQ